MSKLNIAVNIYVGEEKVQKIALGDKVVYVSENPPVIDSLIGNETNTDEITLQYEIDDGGGALSAIEYSQDSGTTWTPLGSTDVTGSVLIDNLTAGNVYTFLVRATNSAGQAVSDEISVFLSGDTLIFSEDFEAVGKVIDDFWRDPNNDNPVAGGNVRIKENFTQTGKDVQISYIAWNLGNGTFRGTRRLEHPFSYFNIEPARAYELSVDWFFEDIWDWNTIGRDREEMKNRLVTYGRFSNGQKIAYTEPEADDYLDTIIGGAESMGPGTDYYDTGFPYQTGKMHGLVSSHDGDAPAGSQPKEPDEWSARVVWVKDVNSHPTQDGGGVYTDGADPNVPPKLAAYIYDQSRVQDGNGDWPAGRFLFADDFTTLSKETWYTIKLFVQLNDVGKSNGICKLTILDRDTETVHGTAYADDIQWHDSPNINNALIERLMFSTFFGGGNLRYSPKIDPNWANDVDVNNGVYARNDNYKATRLGALAPPTIEGESYTGNDIELTVGYSFSFSQVDDVEYNVTPNGGTYDAANWTSATYSVANEEATFTISGVSNDDMIRVRIDRGGRKSARSAAQKVEIPGVPEAPSIDFIEAKDTKLQLNFSPSPSDGNSPVTDYEYRLDGGTAVSTGIDGIDFTTAGYLISGLTNGQVYDVEIRAVNAIGNSAWSTPVSQSPTPAFNFPVPTNGLARYWDAGELGLNDGASVTSVEDKTESSNLAVMTGATAPTYKTAIVNGESVMRFNGVDNALEDNGGGLGNITDEASLYIVASAAAEDQQGSLLSTSPWDTANILNVHSPYTLSGGTKKIAWDFGDRGTGGRLLEDWPAATGQFCIWEFRVKSGLMSVYRNGTLQYVKTESSAVNLVNKVLRMGWSPDGFFSGDIAICLPYSRYLETDEQDRIDILNYLGIRYGITVNTPTAPSIVNIATTPGDQQVIIDWNVLQNESDLSKIELETAGTWQTLLDNAENYVDPVGDFIKSGLTNDTPVDFRMRFTNNIGVTTSAIFSETPTETVGELISQQGGANDTENISLAITNAQNNGVPVLVDGVFTDSIARTINGAITFKAADGWAQSSQTNPNPAEATIHTDGNWRFRGDTIVDGVFLNDGRTKVRPFEFGHDGGHITLKNNTHFAGCKNGYGDSLAIVTTVKAACASFTWNGGSCSDAHSTNLLPSTDRSAPDGITIRGHYVETGFSGVHTLKNFRLFNIGHDLEYSDGQTIWQKPYSDQNWDVDGMDLRGDEVNTLHVLENVTMESVAGTFIKSSLGGRRFEVDGLTLRVKSGEWQTGRFIRLQDNNGNAPATSHYSGFFRNVLLDIQGTRDGDNDLNKTLIAVNPQLGVTENDAFIQFENITYRSNDYRGDEAIFGTHYRASGNFHIGIKNVVTDDKVGWLFRNFRQGRADVGAEDDGHLTFEGNSGLDLGQGWFHDAPWRVWENNCRVYVRWKIKLIGTNTFLDGGTPVSFDYDNVIFEDYGPSGSSPYHVYAENANYEDASGSFQTDPCWGSNDPNDVRQFEAKP